MHHRSTTLASLFGRPRGGALRSTFAKPHPRKRSIRSSAIEPLEARRLLTTFYAAASYFDQTTGLVTASPAIGDLVTWDKGNADQVTGLTFGTGGSAFTNIQDAINATADGDTVRVAAGLYQLTAELDVGTSISILGPQANVDPRPSAGSPRVAGGANEAIIDGGNTAFDAFFVEASNVTINGFDLRNTADEVIDTADTGSYTNVQILNNFIHGAADPATGKGVHFQGVSGGLVANNDIYEVNDAGIEIGSGSVSSSPDCVVKNNDVHDLGSGGLTNSAIYAFATPYATDINVTIDGNLIYNFNGNDAIKVGSKDGSDHALAGGTVSNNIIHDVVQDGITIDASKTNVTGNEVYHSSSQNAAIYVEHSDGNVTIANNSLHDNTAAVATILVGDGSTVPTAVAVNENSLQNNANNTLLYRDMGTGQVLDASANWWGSSATSTVQANVLSTTAGKVDFTPWLNSGTDTNLTTPGFQPDLSSLTLAPATISAQAGSVGRVQEAINLTTNGGTITVLDGTYNEDVNVNKNVTVNASGTIDGKITGTIGTIVASGPLTLGDGSATAVNTSSNLNVGGQTVTLLDSAAANLGGTTTISGGTLAAANGVNIANGGTLTGSGTVSGDLSAASGGTLSPATGGTLTVDNVSLTSGATFNVNLTSIFQYSKFAAAGTVNLNGATLAGTTGPNVSAGNNFTIIKNNGPNPITGTFNGLPEGATVALGNGLFTISYVGGSGHDVVLTSVNQVPAITGFLPTALVEGSGDTLLTVNGSGFTNGSTVEVNGQPVATTFFTPAQLQATIPAADMAEEGSLSITVVSPGPGGGTSTAVLLPINDAPLTATSVSLTATEGTTLSGVVASFVDADPNGTVSDYSANISWGDGTVTTADSIAASGNGFVVYGSHAYVEDGSYSVTVTIQDMGGASATAVSTAAVAEAALTPTAGTVNGFEFSALNNVVLATFTHGNGTEPTSGFSATVDWGDGNTSPASITASGATYSVLGSHTYTDEGNYTIKVIVKDESTSVTIPVAATILEQLLPDGTRGTADERFISELYRDLFHRQVEMGGLTFWNNQLVNGESRGQIARQLIVAGPPFEYYQTVVTGLYQTYLNRAPEADGLAYYVSMMQNGATQEIVAANLAASPEFFQNAGGTNAGFLNALYEDALHRPIDAPAEAQLEGFLANGGTRNAVAAMVFASPEYHADVVAGLYLEFLDRPADPNGLAYFTTQLDHGATDQQIVAQLVASDEYFARIAS